jgi:hypothetical protein
VCLPGTLGMSEVIELDINIAFCHVCGVYFEACFWAIPSIYRNYNKKTRFPSSNYLMTLCSSSLSFFSSLSSSLSALGVHTDCVLV